MQKRLLLAFIIVGLVACAGTRDATLTDVAVGNGVTHVLPGRPMQFAARQPGLAVPGADFMYVAPVGVSRRGALRHYLWLGVRSTVDRRLRGTPTPDIERVLLLVDGKPVRMEFEQWDAVSPAPAYDAPHFAIATLAARISPSQMRWLSQADTFSILTEDTNGRQTRYVVDGDWHNAFALFDTSLSATTSPTP